jgi:lipopolysaccharide/colanic/teichoic acid biosynthesis glycosyltransferase
MTLRQDEFRLQKYLKATQAASYGAWIDYGVDYGRRAGIASPWTGTWRKFGSFGSTVKDLACRHLLSNGMVVASWALSRTALKPARQSALTASTRLRLALHWLGALVLLALALPVFFLVGLAIKLDSSGPVFFRQERIGLNRRRSDRRRRGDCVLNCKRASDRRASNQYGKPFMVYKFRTMVVNAEKRCGPIWATKNDPRVTSVGRFLRKTRLDELPQLLNVLRGEMALVGPRPERPFFVDKLAGQVEDYTERLRVKPGITGLAQVENGYDGSVDDVRAKVSYDLNYIRTSSLKCDLVILVKTIGVVLGCRGV